MCHLINLYVSRLSLEIITSVSQKRWGQKGSAEFNAQSHTINLKHSGSKVKQNLRGVKR